MHVLNIVTAANVSNTDTLPSARLDRIFIRFACFKEKMSTLGQSFLKKEARMLRWKTIKVTKFSEAMFLVETRCLKVKSIEPDSDATSFTRNVFGHVHQA